MNNPDLEFVQECATRVNSYSNGAIARAAHDFMVASTVPKYSYNFRWLSRPIIQYPQDIVAIQELIWNIRPDLIIETGIAHGGSLILSASMLALLEYCDAAQVGNAVNPSRPARHVLGIDIDIRPHNRKAIEAHPLSNRITLIEGSSVAPEVVEKVWAYARPFERILLMLDSNHTHEHVLRELDAYAGLVSQDSYCVVLDTIIEDLPSETIRNRPWGKGNNPKTAVREFLTNLNKQARTGRDGAPLRFAVDEALGGKLLITVAPGGYLKRSIG